MILKSKTIIEKKLGQDWMIYLSCHWQFTFGVGIVSQDCLGQYFALATIWFGPFTASLQRAVPIPSLGVSWPGR